jgi:hypothetical protein
MRQLTVDDVLGLANAAEWIRAVLANHDAGKNSSSFVREQSPRMVASLGLELAVLQRLGVPVDVRGPALPEVPAFRLRASLRVIPEASTEERAVLALVADLLPYAESRAEDLQELAEKLAGEREEALRASRTSPAAEAVTEARQAADKAWQAVQAARRLVPIPAPEGDGAGGAA